MGGAGVACLCSWGGFDKAYFPRNRPGRTSSTSLGIGSMDLWPVRWLVGGLHFVVII